MTTLSYARNGQKFEATVEELPPEAIKYLLQYGWAQSLQDCIAGREKRVRDEMFAKKHEELGDAFDAMSDDETQRLDDEVELAVLADIEGTLSKRADAIKSGTVGIRVGESRDPLRAVANDMVRKAFAAKGFKADKEKVAAKVEELLATKRESVQAEFDRRKAVEIDVEI